MTSYTIGEIAARSGFSSSALRYYEDIGLVQPASRTDAGYRLYDDHTLAQLAFVARAKQLGCSLGEIVELVKLWDGDRCGPVQRRLHELVTTKIHDADRQIAELSELGAQLRGAATQLAGPAVDGPCGENCACTGSAAPVPIACSLDETDLRDQLSAWQAMGSHVRNRIRTGDGALRVEFDDDVPVAQLAALAAAEQRCCPFFSFAITVDRRGIGLEVVAPDDAAEAVTALFGLL